MFDPKQNVIQYYNPVDCLTPYSILDAQKEFFEWILNKSIQLVSASNYPKQNNSTDCGLFVIKYVQFILLEKPLTKWIDLQIPDFRVELVSVFTPFCNIELNTKHTTTKNPKLVCSDTSAVLNSI